MGKNGNGSFIVGDGSKNQGRLISELIKAEYNTQIDEDEKAIRAHKDFRMIKMEYDKVMRLYRKRINEMLEGKELNIDERYAIINS